ncbi:MAG TPA: inositol monophosphatase family protein [Mycobacteriales bacterium]|nr:inositol monophosphatase family protein [Mycobacteriales bacterium]
MLTHPLPAARQRELLRSAEIAATAAGSRLNAATGGAVRKGAAHDVVTAADTEAEALIRDLLIERHPGSAVLGEEYGLAGGGPLRWIIDPLDGTYNFTRGFPAFAVSIGIEHDGHPVGGCVFDPVRKELISGSSAGLFCNGTRIAAPARPAGPPLILSDIPAAGIAADRSEYDFLQELLTIGADVRRVGSTALALAWVAIGRADLAANADVFAWDVAAGRCLVTAAGGGFAAVPELRTERPGGFVAWAPGYEATGRRLAELVTGFSTLTE